MNLISVQYVGTEAGILKNYCATNSGSPEVDQLFKVVSRVPAGISLPLLLYFISKMKHCSTNKFADMKQKKTFLSS
jgi:hypothetical protein